MAKRLVDPVVRTVQRAARGAEVGVISIGFSAIGCGLLRLPLVLSGRRWQGLYVIGGGVERRLKLLPELLRFGAKTEKRGTKIVQGFIVGLGVVQALLDPVEFLAPVLYPGVDVQAHRIVGLLEDRGMVDFRRLRGRAWRSRRAGCAAAGACGLWAMAPAPMTVKIAKSEHTIANAATTSDTPSFRKLKRSAGVLEANRADNKAIAMAAVLVRICPSSRDRGERGAS